MRVRGSGCCEQYALNQFLRQTPCGDIRAAETADARHFQVGIGPQNWRRHRALRAEGSRRSIRKGNRLEFAGEQQMVLLLDGLVNDEHDRVTAAPLPLWTT